MSKRNIFLAYLFFIFNIILSSQPSSALDIPTLTWERGKTQDVVLGGDAENLNWNLYLVQTESKEKVELKFQSSRSNSSNFQVYKVAVPKELELGEFYIVARDDKETESVLAIVQVVNRFQYQILEIPRDLLFILFGLILFLSMQLTLRLWTRLTYLSQPLLIQSNQGIINTLIRGMELQRLRWQQKWIGPDMHVEGRRGLGRIPESMLPLFAIVSGTYVGVNQSLKSIDGIGNTVFVALLAVIAFVDPYSGKLLTLSYISFFVVFNDSLNFPALLHLILSVAIFQLPRYVSDVSKEFITREFDMTERRHSYRLSSSISSLASGISVFWLYLVSESVIVSGTTNASNVIPLAIGVSLANMYLESKYSEESIKEDFEPRSQLKVVQPILKFQTLMVLSLIAIGTVYVWTDNLPISILFVFLTLGGLVSIYFSPSQEREIRSPILRLPYVVILLVAMFSSLIAYFVSTIPEVTRDRSVITLIFGSIPVFLFSLWALYFSKRSQTQLWKSPEDKILDQEKFPVQP